jgi:hypothetical protein
VIGANEVVSLLLRVDVLVGCMMGVSVGSVSPAGLSAASVPPANGLVAYLDISVWSRAPWVTTRLCCVAGGISIGGELPGPTVVVEGAVGAVTKDSVSKLGSSWDGSRFCLMLVDMRSYRETITFWMLVRPSIRASTASIFESVVEWNLEM